MVHDSHFGAEAFNDGVSPPRSQGQVCSGTEWQHPFQPGGELLSKVAAESFPCVREIDHGTLSQKEEHKITPLEGTEIKFILEDEHKNRLEISPRKSAPVLRKMLACVIRSSIKCLI